ncbi:MAG: tetratricopeptide repeat protein [Candidatus Omnitrophota bacterium]
MKNKREILCLAAIFFFALALRLAYMFFLKKEYLFYDHPADDVLYYQEWAGEIAAGDWIGKRAFWGMPLYPYFLAILMPFSFGSTEVLRIFHLILGSANVLLVYFIAKQIFSRPTAWLAAFFTATNFILIYYDWLMMPVTLIITLSLILVYGFLTLSPSSKRSEWFILGIVFGLSTLSDGKFLIFFAFTLIYLAWQYRPPGKKTFIKVFLPLIAGALIIILGVAIRNRVIGKDWVLTSAHGGINFYIGNNPKASGVFDNPQFIRPDHNGFETDTRIIAEQALKRSLRPSEVSQFWMDQGIEFIRKNPGQYLSLLGKKIAAFFQDTERSYDIDLVFQIPYKNKFDFNSLRIIFPLAITGFIFAFVNSRKFAFPALLIASQLIFTLCFFLITRHRATILPFLIIFQSFCIIWAINQIKEKKWNMLIIAALISLGMFLILKPVSIDPKIVSFLRSSKAGPLLAEQKRFDEARREYLSALKLQPFDVNSIYNLANTYVAENNFKDAISWYERALQINPRDVDALYNLAYCQEQNKNTNTAIKLYEELLRLSPESLDGHYRLGNIYLSQSQCEKAKTHFNIIAQSNPSVQDELKNALDSCRP